MEAIILAGGLGTRLRQVVPNLPKAMAHVAGKPFLEILLHSLSRKGFARVVLSLGYMANKISEYFGESFAGMTLVYVVEESPLGTGGAVRLALSACRQDHVYVLNGDTFLDLEVNLIEQLWRENGYPIIVGREVSDAARYGCLTVEDNCVTNFSEKGVVGPGLINGGCYVLDRECLDRFPRNTAFSLETDFLVDLVGKTKVNIFITKGLFIDIGIPSDYTLAQKVLADF
jgi:D-glycero-alpha-D-manno-heptose 1-phosphate guanylyltransferase